MNKHDFSLSPKTDKLRRNRKIHRHLKGLLETLGGVIIGSILAYGFVVFILFPAVEYITNYN